ncbi:UvrD-helicase domain-containing protein [Nocardia asteroides]|uniref:UvrD-helicase domain-containing protein n=1 Tax=Nocardia asteroides TaxID=1824 RepID=UPI001E51AF21|nr:UvrD-helicase domain-containing protein [Nocardia asteroides]UGT64411.1 UvrD-helicase domain-containing protein [Nocardia asteroides]
MNAQGIVIAKGERRYLDSNSRAYKDFLSKLAVDVAKAAEGSVIDRLQRIYDEIYIDEVQDLTGSDLDVLELLLKSACELRMVGDLRQSLLSTNPKDRRHPQYRGLGMLKWFEEQERQGRLGVSHASETWRSVQEVADFSDTIFASALGFPPTLSKQTAVSEHDGVFVIGVEHIGDYIAAFSPICLRERVSTRVPEGIAAVNFGQAKGLTHERVVIFPTDSVKKFLYKGTALPERSAFGLYVGVTRAVHSVAFVLDKPEKSRLMRWVPDGQLALKVAIPHSLFESAPATAY